MKEKHCVTPITLPINMYSDQEDEEEELAFLLRGLERLGDLLE